MTFGDRLRIARLEKGLTQEALAEKLGKQKQTISRYENSLREPNIMIAKELADALGITLEYLTTDERDNSFSPTKQKIIDIVNSMTDEQLKKLLPLFEAAAKIK